MSVVKRGASSYRIRVSHLGKRVEKTLKTGSVAEARRAEEELKLKLSLEKRSAALHLPTTWVPDDEWSEQVHRWAEDPDSWIRRSLRGVSSRSKRKDITAVLTLEHIVTAALRSCGRCELTGTPFSETKQPHWQTMPYSPSIDRIDSSQGYAPHNIRIVCFAANVALGQWGEDVFKVIASNYVTKRLRE